MFDNRVFTNYVRRKVNSLGVIRIPEREAIYLRLRYKVFRIYPFTNVENYPPTVRDIASKTIFKVIRNALFLSLLEDFKSLKGNFARRVLAESIG